MENYLKKRIFGTEVKRSGGCKLLFIIYLIFFLLLCKFFNLLRYLYKETPRGKIFYLYTVNLVFVLLPLRFFF